mmetsp:Transcript_8752/g.26210  ORF Transcript_8752/g.26210 Transcript_8752/m.26210 type:complete len:203 (-) Transcript_8752:5102-5710(-)
MCQTSCQTARYPAVATAAPATRVTIWARAQATLGVISGRTTVPCRCLRARTNQSAAQTAAAAGTVPAAVAVAAPRRPSAAPTLQVSVHRARPCLARRTARQRCRAQPLAEMGVRVTAGRRTGGASSWACGGTCRRTATATLSAATCGRLWLPHQERTLVSGWRPGRTSLAFHWSQWHLKMVMATAPKALALVLLRRPSGRRS